MLVQAESSNAGLAQRSAPLTWGESPGANFHGPGRAMKESPRCTSVGGAVGKDCAGATRHARSSSGSRRSRASRMGWRLHEKMCRVGGFVEDAAGFRIVRL